jgi:hypothetical protein
MQNKRSEPWSWAGDAQLLALRAVGFKNREIAQTLGRTEVAVMLRWELLKNRYLDQPPQTAGHPAAPIA